MGELRVRWILEQVLCVGDPLAFAGGVSGILDRAEFGDHHLFCRVHEAEVANGFDDRLSSHPWCADADSTFVPVVGVGCDGFYPLITRVPTVGVASVGVWFLEREVGHDPHAAGEFHTLSIEDSHEVAPCSDEVISVTVRNVGTGFRFVVERQPDL